MMPIEAWRKGRYRLIVDRAGLKTAADLDRFLENDPKTKDDLEKRQYWRTTLQRECPELRDSQPTT